MRALKINEISAVDVPAQQGAVACIMKRRDGPSDTSQKDELAKAGAMLTTPNDGHAHLLYTVGHGGHELNSGTTSYVDGHEHPWIRTEDGRIVIGEARGHSHDADQMSKTAGEPGNVGTKEDTMTDKTQKADGQPTVEDLQKQLARANQVAALNDAEKAHFNTLKGDDADGFLAKSADERKAAIEAVAKAAEGDDPVVYTTMDGVALRKSAGEAFISMAKSNDALRKRLDESESAREQAALEKRAEDELAHLPGDVKARAALLKAAEGIEDEAQRTAAVAALKAQNAAMKGAFETRGHAVGKAAPGSPDEELENLVKEHMEKNAGTSYEVAYDAVLKTKRGEELYAKTLN
ncbi:hypothetical protein ELZ19_06710 [Brucella abortus]|nr:hypothetical protein IB60_17120 [Brucella abortus LMN1]RUQ67373.1 hypothetical protein ELZ23_15545 [Brucella abortus]RUQ78158.1 hypothetical protein ELZ22_17330 [Brucella abortus]RUQ88318.1 hypothetical protein ELZ18_15535 [Brucella abortus]RUQ90347.1 hypothetical protein ELZ20_15530 [Brucella abortus]